MLYREISLKNCWEDVFIMLEFTDEVRKGTGKICFVVLDTDEEIVTLSAKIKGGKNRLFEVIRTDPSPFQLAVHGTVHLKSQDRVVDERWRIRPYGLKLKYNPVIAGQLHLAGHLLRSAAQAY